MGLEGVYLLQSQSHCKDAPTSGHRNTLTSTTRVLGDLDSGNEPQRPLGFPVTTGECEYGSGISRGTGDVDPPFFICVEKTLRGVKGLSASSTSEIFCTESRNRTGGPD